MNSEICWAAGLIDGEGCITIHRRHSTKDKMKNHSPYYRLELFVKMVHKPTIERIQRLFQIGTISKQTPGKNNKRIIWKWTVYGKDCIKVIDAVMPYCSVKADDMKLGLQFLPLNVKTTGGNQRVSDDILQKREAIYNEMKLVKQYEWKE